MVDTPQGERVWQLGVVLHAAGNAAVVESSAHSSWVGGELTAPQFPLLVVGGPHLQGAQWDSGHPPGDLAEHWADWSGGDRAQHITSCHMTRDPGIVEISESREALVSNLSSLSGRLSGLGLGGCGFDPLLLMLPKWSPLSPAWHSVFS